MLLEELESLDNYSDKIGSELGSSGMYSFCTFYLRAEDSVTSVYSSNIFAPTRI